MARLGSCWACWKACWRAGRAEHARPGVLVYRPGVLGVLGVLITCWRARWACSLNVLSTPTGRAGRACRAC
jgi:hypothetical protein